MKSISPFLAASMIWLPVYDGGVLRKVNFMIAGRLFEEIGLVVKFFNELLDSDKDSGILSNVNGNIPDINKRLSKHYIFHERNQLLQDNEWYGFPFCFFAVLHDELFRKNVARKNGHIVHNRRTATMKHGRANQRLFCMILGVDNYPKWTPRIKITCYRVAHKYRSLTGTPARSSRGNTPQQSSGSQAAHDFRFSSWRPLYVSGFRKQALQRPCFRCQPRRLRWRHLERSMAAAKVVERKE